MRGANSRASDFTRLCAPARAAAVADHVGFRLIGEQRVHRHDRGRVALVEHRLEGAHRIDLAEELQLQLLAPGLVGGVREGRHARLPGIVDQDVAAPLPLLDRGRERRDLVLVEHVAAHRQEIVVRTRCRADSISPTASRASSRPQIATAAPSARKSRAVASPMPDVPPVTTATLPASPRSMRSACGQRNRIGLGRVGAAPAEAAGNLGARRSQFLADERAALLAGECADRTRDVDRAERRAGEVEHRHRGRADAGLEIGIAPGDAGVQVLRRFRLQRLQRGRGVRTEALAAPCRRKAARSRSAACRRGSCGPWWWHAPAAGCRPGCCWRAACWACAGRGRARRCRRARRDARRAQAPRRAA